MRQVQEVVCWIMEQKGDAMDIGIENRELEMMSTCCSARTAGESTSIKRDAKYLIWVDCHRL